MVLVAAGKSMNKICFNKMSHNCFKFFSVANMRKSLPGGFCTYKDTDLVRK